MLGGSRPDVAVVDVGLPGMSGLDLVGTIRDGGADDPWDAGMPILLISGQTSPHAAVRGIERGADDYVAKPFHYPEVLARLGALIRRSRGATLREEIRVGPARGRPPWAPGDAGRDGARPVGQGVRAARRPGQGSRPRAHQGRAAARRLGLPRTPARTRTVDSHASRLRRKLAACGAGERWVANVWGVGYRLLPEEA